jgi:hypothetical protein
MDTPVTAAIRIDGMPERAAVTALAVRRRRESYREERSEHIRLNRLLTYYLDPSCTFWTSIENKPLSAIAGMFQKRRGVRSGLPDVLVIYRRKPVFIELKSRRGVVSKAQQQIRAELLPAGAVWWVVRSAYAALVALQRSGVVFRREWQPPQLEPWEGPFADTKRLPVPPDVAAERRAASQRRRERQRAKLAAARDDAEGADIAA